jgi:ubiquinone/menaquinone biosynthesis C-methylase UbiE
MKIEKIGKEKISLSKDLIEDFKDLGINQEMIKGKILDVGAGEAELAKAFKHIKDVEINSIDTQINEENKEFVIEADCRKIPYPDDSFDMVLAHASIPNIFLGKYESEKETESQILQSFFEIIRVLKNGKKAYLSPVNMANNYEPQRILKNAILKSLKELKQRKIKISFNLYKTETNPTNKEKTDCYRLIIEKQKKIMAPIERNH